MTIALCTEVLIQDGVHESMCPVCSGGRQWLLAFGAHSRTTALESRLQELCVSSRVMPGHASRFPHFLPRIPSPGLTPHAQGAQGRIISRMCAHFYFKYSTLLGVITVHFTDSFTGSQSKDGMIYNRHIKNKILNLYLETVASFYLCFNEHVMVSKRENEISVWFWGEVNMDTGIPLCFGTHQRSADRPVALWTPWAKGQVSRRWTRRPGGTQSTFWDLSRDLIPAPQLDPVYGTIIYIINFTHSRGTRSLFLVYSHSCTIITT